MMDHNMFSSRLKEVSELLHKERPDLPDVAATYKKSAEIIDRLNFQMENPLSVEELQEMGITAMNTPAIKDYGKTWVAYRRRPEEVTS